MDIEIIILSQRQISYYVAYVWNQKKSDTDELKYRNTNRPTHIENKLTVPKGEKER